MANKSDTCLGCVSLCLDFDIYDFDGITIMCSVNLERFTDQGNFPTRRGVDRDDLLRVLDEVVVTKKDCKDYRSL